MKVTGPNGVGKAGSASSARPAAGGAGFRLPGVSAPSAPAPAAQASGLAGVGGVDALLALQASGGPLERKRRAIGRAGRMLDVLDEIKVGLLGGDLTQGDLERLRRAVREERDQTDEPGLESVLDEIETRAAVELAKLETASRAA